MIHTKSVQNLLKKDMSRKEFLQVIAAGILGVIGFSAFIKNLDKFAQSQTKTAGSKKTGYGSSPYGR